ncbi:hypothetical protein IFM89_033969 [Coptis chinensis]|uniref:Uncharacterized protein n=1 Tax=Coptis chinensis TaxID=261450 RepID=A0A835HTV5_9MAGN|nr:hypothetical protein IFM89_033969 [Coptis chinensis]
MTKAWLLYHIAHAILDRPNPEKFSSSTKARSEIVICGLKRVLDDIQSCLEPSEDTVTVTDPNDNTSENGGTSITVHAPPRKKKLKGPTGRIHGISDRMKKNGKTEPKKQKEVAGKNGQTLEQRENSALISSKLDHVPQVILGSLTEPSNGFISRGWSGLSSGFVREPQFFKNTTKSNFHGLSNSYGHSDPSNTSLLPFTDSCLFPQGFVELLSQHPSNIVARPNPLRGPTRHLDFSKPYSSDQCDTVYKALLEKTKSVPGAKVENNRLCVSVHFRCVDEKIEDKDLAFLFLKVQKIQMFLILSRNQRSYGFFAPVSRMEVTVTSRAFRGLVRKEILPIHE